MKTLRTRFVVALGLAAIACAGMAIAQVSGWRLADRAADRLGLPAQPSIDEAQLLSDPFLQLPTEDSVRVVWVTEFEGARHVLVYGEGLNGLGRDALVAAARGELVAGPTGARLRVVDADTLLMSRTREDERSRVPGRTYEAETRREVWRHEAVASGLTAGERTPYAVVSLREDGAVAASETFTLAPLPPAGQPLKILLTSDHQLKANTPANLQKVEQTVGRVDAVFFAGDLVNIPDRASEWFDDERGFAFFPGLQGRANRVETKSGTPVTYVGGELIQHAPLFPALGNHEVMGRVSERNLGGEYNDPKPRAVAARAYEKVADQVNPAGDPELRARWIENNSYNYDTYVELFTLPESETGGETYYATTIGDVRLVSLFATRIWRTPAIDRNRQSKFDEPTGSFGDEMEQGWGSHIFERIDVGSEQYEWLARELQSEAFRSARYKVVLVHHPIHTLGDNVNPPFTDPVRIVERDDAGNVTRIRYEYPKPDNHLVRDVEPLLNAAGVDLVHNGHSHVWNRFRNEAGVNFIETSNVGNNYGAYVVGGRTRGNVPPSPPWNAENYDGQGDPYGLEPFVPTVEPLVDDEGNPLPYVASNDYTVFSILDTGTGEVTSYIYDVREPELGVRVLDVFDLD